MNQKPLFLIFITTLLFSGASNAGEKLLYACPKPGEAFVKVGEIWRGHATVAGQDMVCPNAEQKYVPNSCTVEGIRGDPNKADELQPSYVGQDGFRCAYFNMFTDEKGFIYIYVPQKNLVPNCTRKPPNSSNSFECEQF